MVTGYLLWSMREPEYEKEGMLVENEVTAYYNMTETGIPALRQPETYGSLPSSGPDADGHSAFG